MNNAISNKVTLLLNKLYKIHNDIDAILITLDFMLLFMGGHQRLSLFFVISPSYQNPDSITMFLEIASIDLIRWIWTYIALKKKKHKHNMKRKIWRFHSHSKISVNQYQNRKSKIDYKKRTFILGRKSVCSGLCVFVCNWVLPSKMYYMNKVDFLFMLFHFISVIFHGIKRYFR